MISFLVNSLMLQLKCACAFSEPLQTSLRFEIYWWDSGLLSTKASIASFRLSNNICLALLQSSSSLLQSSSMSASITASYNCCPKQVLWLRKGRSRSSIKSNSTFSPLFWSCRVRVSKRISSLSTSSPRLIFKRLFLRVLRCV